MFEGGRHVYVGDCDGSRENLQIKTIQCTFSESDHHGLEKTYAPTISSDSSSGWWQYGRLESYVSLAERTLSI